MRDPKTKMFAEACAMLKQAEQLQRHFFGQCEDTRAANWEPPVDVFETDREITIITALPGVAPEAVRAEIEGTTLIITGTRPMPTAARRAKIVRLEIPTAVSSGVCQYPAVSTGGQGVEKWLPDPDLYEGGLTDDRSPEHE